VLYVIIFQQVAPVTMPLIYGGAVITIHSSAMLWSMRLMRASNLIMRPIISKVTQSIITSSCIPVKLQGKGDLILRMMRRARDLALISISFTAIADIPGIGEQTDRRPILRHGRGQHRRTRTLLNPHQAFITSIIPPAEMTMEGVTEVLLHQPLQP